MTVDELVTLLTTGPNVVGEGMTIPEGYTLAQIASTVEQFTGGRISAADFTAAASDASVYAGEFPFLADAGSNSLEGYLFPKTYEVADDATADSLIRLMLQQFQAETASLDWSYPESIGLRAIESGEGSPRSSRRSPAATRRSARRWRRCSTTA